MLSCTLCNILCQYIDVLMDQHIGALMNQCIDMPMHQCVDDHSRFLGTLRSPPHVICPRRPQHRYSVDTSMYSCVNSFTAMVPHAGPRAQRSQAKWSRWSDHHSICVFLQISGFSAHWTSNINSFTLSNVRVCTFLSFLWIFLEYNTLLFMLSFSISKLSLV